MESIADILGIFLQTERILSLLLVLSFIGLGLFINRSLWPWFVNYAKINQDSNIQLRTMQLEVIKDSLNRWEDLVKEQHNQAKQLDKQLGTIKELLRNLIYISNVPNKEDLVKKLDVDNT